MKAPMTYKKREKEIIFQFKNEKKEEIFGLPMFYFLAFSFYY
jgi:hypothetical protein